MVTVEDAVIAKIEKGGTHFEVLVDPAIAYDLKEGMAVSLGRMLAVNAVFTDSKKGLRASDKHLQEMFKTDDIEKIARDIVVNGDVQITTEFRRKKIEERKRQIAEFISRNAHNPQTGTPHPPDEQEPVKVASAIHALNLSCFVASGSCEDGASRSRLTMHPPMFVAVRGSTPRPNGAPRTGLVGVPTGPLIGCLLSRRKWISVVRRREARRRLAETHVRTPNPDPSQVTD